MYLPREIRAIIAEFCPFPIMGERYKPIDNRFSGYSDRELWKDPYLYEYLAEKKGSVPSNLAEAIFREPRLIPILKKYSTEKEILKEKYGRIYVFPIFYGKERIAEYLEKHKIDIILYINHKPYPGDAYLPLIEWMAPNAKYEHLAKTWSILSRYSDNFALLKTRSRFIAPDELAHNKSPRAMEFFLEHCRVSRDSEITVKNTIFYHEFMKYSVNAKYFLDHPELISENFMLNPHPDAVDYYLRNPEKITCTFAANENPRAVEYMVKNKRKYNHEEFMRKFSPNPAAVPFMLENAALFDPRYAYKNKDFGMLYEKYSERTFLDAGEYGHHYEGEHRSIYMTVDGYYDGYSQGSKYLHVRDYAREQRENIKFFVDGEL